MVAEPSNFIERRLAHFAEAGVAHWPRFQPGDETHDGVVLYLPSQLIASRKTTGLVDGELSRRFGTRREREEHQDFSVFHLPEGADSLDVAARLRRTGAGVSPHPVLNLAQGVPRIGPGDDPQPAKEATGPQCDDLGSRPSVGVVDTGVIDGHVTAAGTHIDHPDIDPGDGCVDWYGAVHGTFIAGIYTRHAPGCRVSHGKAVADNGMVTLAAFLKTTDEIVSQGVEVLNLSLGLYRAPGVGIPGLKRAVKRWIRTSREQHKIDLLIAAAAGNDSKSQRFYPAGLSTDPDVGASIMAVGALDRPDEDGEIRPAEFSNFGGWVNAWAPGVGLASDYAGGGITFDYGNGVTAAFEGLATWSGTSFATPYAAAAVMRYADANGISPLHAWHKIRGGRPWVLFD